MHTSIELVMKNYVIQAHFVGTLSATYIDSTSSALVKNYVRRLRPEEGGKHHFLSFHIIDRAVTDKQVEKTDQIRPRIPETSRA